MANRLVKIVHAGMSAGAAALVSGEMQDNVTAAGTTQATATAVSGDYVVVTTAAASTGVIIAGEPLSAGDVIHVCNQGANAVLVYPPVGGTINALSLNAGYSITAGKTGMIIVRADTTKFIGGMTL